MMFREGMLLYFDTYTNFTLALQDKCHGYNTTFK